jgi:hypothetical protein
MRLAHPPVTFRHEKLKVEQRIPAAQRYIAEHRLNERFDGDRRPAAGHRRAGRAVPGADPRAAARGPGRRLRRQPHPAAGAERHLPAGAGRGGRLLRRQAARCWCWRRATPSTSRRTCCWRCAAGPADAGARQGPAARPPASTRSRPWCRPAGLPGTPRRRHRHHGRRAPGWPPTPRAAPTWPALGPLPRGRRASASAAPSGRCSARSSWRSRRSARCTSRPTSAAMRWPPSSPSARAIRSWATA